MSRKDDVQADSDSKTGGEMEGWAGDIRQVSRPVDSRRTHIDVKIETDS